MLDHLKEILTFKVGSLVLLLLCGLYLLQRILVGLLLTLVLHEARDVVLRDLWLTLGEGHELLTGLKLLCELHLRLSR